MSVGTRIATLRKALGISQNQLAKEMEVSRQAVSKWENDQTVPDSINMIRLSDILKTDIEYLATGRVSKCNPLPVVINSVQTVEKVVEKPIIEYKETVRIIEKPVEIVKFIEKPVVQKVYRREIFRNPFEFALCGAIFLILGFLIGLLF